jgi:vacuolar iron transporter family protein
MTDQTLSGAKLETILSTLEGNWQTEMAGYHTCQALADRETDPVRVQLMLRLAVAKSGHAALWAGRIKELGQSAPLFHGSLDGNADSVASHAGSVRRALHGLETELSVDIVKYGEQLKLLGDEGSTAILDRIIGDDKDYCRELRSLVHDHDAAPAGADSINAKAALEQLLRKRSHGRKQPASWIGDAIYGVNDGLGSIFGIVSGVSGATAGDSRYVLLAGLTGLIASALSMGSGAYLAAKSEREIYLAEVAREREAIQMDRAGASELLSLYYQARGFPKGQADHEVMHIARDPDLLLNSLARERLGTSEEALSKPVVSAASGALSTAIGAAIPVVPFFFVHGIEAVIAAAVVSLTAHFAVGAAKSLITVRSWWSSGFEMTVVGALEGAVTYGIGVLLGAGRM